MRGYPLYQPHTITLQLQFVEQLGHAIADRIAYDGAQCMHVAAPSLQVHMAALWPEYVAKQSELDAVACDICHDPGGEDNMAICSMCDRCFHLRCIMPPMSTVPSGDWLCLGCDPVFHNLDELDDPHTVLSYRPGDPYLDDYLCAYVRSGLCHSMLPPDGKRARAIRHAALALKPHPILPSWFLVHKRVRGAGYRWLVCPPVQYRWDLIRGLHDVLGHAGVEQTLTYMHQHYHWTGIKEDIARFVRQCDACQRRKLALPALPPLQAPQVHRPFEHVHVDLCGPFLVPDIDVHGRISRPQASKQPVKAHVVIMVDYFTKAAEFAVVYTKRPAAVARAFYYGWVCRYFVPTYITTDNGSEFADEFVHMVARLGIKHIHTSACHPAANGAVERLVKEFKGLLNRHINAHPEHWVQSVPLVRMQYMSRLHKALGMSPHEMLFGRKPKLAVSTGDAFS